MPSTVTEALILPGPTITVTGSGEAILVLAVLVLVGILYLTYIAVQTLYYILMVREKILGE
jgi:hypothetical protein